MKLLEDKTNLIEEIKEAKNNYTKANIEYKETKCKLLIETDFKEELNSSRPTVDEKNAYVDLKTLELREKKELLYNEIKYLELKLELLNDKISLKVEK